jgi:putative ABC transport system permease protein
VALLLASAGTYGVIAASVGRRRLEFGVRRAVGAGTLHLLGLVLGEGLALSAAGLALGFVAAALAAPGLAGLLFGVGPFDAVTYAGVAVVQVLAAILACWRPAHRAATSDPLDALRVL